VTAAAAVRRAVSRVGLAVIEAVIRRSSLVGDGPFFDAALFPWASRVAAGWSEIRAETDELLRSRATIPPLHEISPMQRGLTDDDHWRALYLFAFGRRVEHNCRRCPATAALLEQIPGLTSALFSILEPGKHIPEHRGPYNGLLRFQLGVQVPPPDGRCRIRVGGETRLWQEAGSLFFDDTFRHEAWNDSDQDRVIVFVDFLRPLPFPVSVLNRLVVFWLSRPSVQKASLEALTSWRAPEPGRPPIRTSGSPGRDGR
jgi:beta-hydroxylase